MSEWTITIETPHGVSTSSDELEAFHDALAEHKSALGASASMNSEAGTIGATFAIYADTVQEAVDAGVAIFNAALESVGLPHGNIVHVDAEPVDDREPVFA